jgi:transposase
MEKGLLEECLAEGMSLEAIGKRVGKHESTVSYWLKKHGLVAAEAEKHAAKGDLEKNTLEVLLADELSLREIASRLDRSLGTVRYWMRRYDLKARPHRHRLPDDGGREATLECRQHGMTRFVLEGRGYYRCSAVGWRGSGVGGERSSASSSGRLVASASSADTTGASARSSSITSIPARRSSTLVTPVRPDLWRGVGPRRVSASCSVPTVTQRWRQGSRRCS